MNTYANFKEYLQNVYYDEIADPLGDYAREFPERVELGDYFDIRMDRR